jgi:hypothetical protein
MRSRSPIRMIVRTTIEVISNQTGISKGARGLSRRGREYVESLSPAQMCVARPEQR